MKKLLLLLALLLAPLSAAAQFTFPPVNPAPAGPGCTYVGPGDVASASYANWWGIRAFNCATAGTKAINIRRASDNTTTDISTLTNGNLDTATAVTFCTATTCFVTKWYDKVSTADAIQATNAEQWQLTFSCDGTLPCVTAQTTDGAGYVTAASFSTAQPYSTSCEMREVTNSIGNPAWCISTSAGFFLMGLDSGNQPHINAGVELDSATSGLNTKLAMAGVFNSTTSSLNWSGTIISGNAGTNSQGGDTYKLGFAGSLTFQMFEAGVASVGWSTTTRDAVEANLAAYW